MCLIFLGVAESLNRCSSGEESSEEESDSSSDHSKNEITIEEMKRNLREEALTIVADFEKFKNETKNKAVQFNLNSTNDESNRATHDSSIINAEDSSPANVSALDVSIQGAAGDLIKKRCNYHCSC